MSARDLYTCYILDNLLVFEEKNWMNMGLGEFEVSLVSFCVLQ